MPKPNSTFELTVDDIERIEGALRRVQTDVDHSDEQHQINELLGRLHNQKTFFRPAKGAYVSG